MRMRITYRTLLLFVGSLLIFLLTSCSPKEEGMKLYPVTGKVLLNDKPTEGAMVVLYAQNPASDLKQPPTAIVKADGTFAVGTLKPEDGAPPGNYKVTILWYPPDAGVRMVETGVASPSLLPSVYGDPNSSGLQIQVKEGPNEVPVFQLKAKK